MNNTQTLNRPKKTSLVKSAAWNIASETILIMTYLYLLIKEQIDFTPEEFLTLYPTFRLISFLNITLLIVTLILMIVHTCNADKHDELSKLHKYKAGYLSKYICIVCIALAIWFIKDFNFAFTNNFFDNLRILFVIFFFSQLVENIIFIILEKCNLE
ncbi:MAG: hypothetical protein E7290_05070 [Lachnospiraceae bacterium]|nr:hypothetical protein [Lachnospiraceae bacterium]